MLTTTDYFAFMRALDPGDLLIFGGTDPMDRLLQWIDGSSYNHVGVWLGDVVDKSDPSNVEENLTIHAGLSSRSLTNDQKIDLFGPDGKSGPARRHGTMWLIPLDVLLDPRGRDEVGGGLQFDTVTAVRWNRQDPLDFGLVAHELMKMMNPETTPPAFDFGQLANLAEFWIKRAYREAGENEALSEVTVSLFNMMKPIIEHEANEIVKARPEPAPGKDPAQQTTCARFVYQAFAEAGYPFTVPIDPSVSGEPMAKEGAVEDWVTPNDILRSPDFKVFAHWTRVPTPRFV